VCDWVLRATCSGVPGGDNFAALIAASGPRSISQSADLMTSRLCSMTSRDAPPSAACETH